ncbi:cell wall-binding repeat-containing protein [Herbiconiux sp.]|uniref:cell wall-binding repeat-containing protein n=1 Tax=Herbiconiux sp. TaxID=1871186 RepID=UPI0025C5EFEF|nr:cell wall-binding repeat-containing protein [Herbiconiux sp.]
MTGDKFPDALTGAASAGGFTAELYLAHPGCVAAGTIAAMKSKGVQFVILIGGTDPLTTDVEALKPCLHPTPLVRLGPSLSHLRDWDDSGSGFHPLDGCVIRPAEHDQLDHSTGPLCSMCVH